MARPGPQNSSCLVNTEYDEPPAVYASTDDAESTITSPNSVSSPNTPSTRCSEVRGRRSHWPNAVAARPTAIRAAVLWAGVDRAVGVRVEVRAVRVDVRVDDRPADRATARVTTGSPPTRPPRRRTRRRGPRSR